MTLTAKMHHTLANFVVVRVAPLPVLWAPDHSAEHKSTSFEVAPQAHVERHFTVVYMYIQMWVLITPILHDERMV